MSKKFLYLFKEGHAAFGVDQTTMKNILGGKGAAGFRSFRCTSVYARHDGYHPEPGPERPGC